VRFPRRPPSAGCNARAARVREELGWIGGRIELVGEGLVFADDPEHYRRRLERQGSATVDVVTRATRAWLGQPTFVLEVEGTGAR